MKKLSKDILKIIYKICPNSKLKESLVVYDYISALYILSDLIERFEEYNNTFYFHTVIVEAIKNDDFDTFKKSFLIAKHIFFYEVVIEIIRFCYDNFEFEKMDEEIRLEKLETYFYNISILRKYDLVNYESLKQYFDYLVKEISKKEFLVNKYEELVEQILNLEEDNEELIRIMISYKMLLTTELAEAYYNNDYDFAKKIRVSIYFHELYQKIENEEIVLIR